MTRTILCSWYGMTFHGPGINNIMLGSYQLRRDVVRDLMLEHKDKTFVLFEGGSDVNPALYKAENTHSYFQDRRDEYETFIYNTALELDMPMLGICRGHQFLNVLRGGTLYQDLRHEYKGEHKHAHEISIERPFTSNHSFLNLMRKGPRPQGKQIWRWWVNSLHHQGLKDLAPETEVVARHCDDRLIEAVRWDRGMSVQWHPEMLGHNAFVEYMFEVYVNDR